MRISIVAMVLLMPMPVITFAENYPAMDKQQMQAMMQQAEKMQACMKNIDQSELHSFEQRGRQMAAEVKVMCNAGQRSAAQSKVIAFSQEIAASPALQKMKKCGEMMKGMMPSIQKMIPSYDSKNSSKHHVCDNLN